MSEKLVEQFLKWYPLVLLQEGASEKKEVIENTMLDPDSTEAWYDEDKTGLDSDIVRVLYTRCPDTSVEDSQIYQVFQ